MGEASNHVSELRVTFGDENEWRDVCVSGVDGHTVGELAWLAGELMQVADSYCFWCERRGRALDRDTPLVGSGIRWGDRLLLQSSTRDPTRVDGAPCVELIVTAGPCAGRRWELAPGSYRLGRDPSSDLVLADPSLSRHHLDVTVDEQGVNILDAGSANGTAIEGKRLAPDRDRRLGEAEELELGRTLLRVRPLQAMSEHAVAQRDGRLDFNRPPRVNPPAQPFSGKLAAPPSRARKARIPLATSLVPLGAGLLLFLFLKSPVMLAIAALSPMMAISTYVGDRRGGSKSFAQAASDFRSELAAVVKQLDQALTEEALVRRAQSPTAPSLIARCRELSPSLWERRPTDSDFLCLRLGVADLPAFSRVGIEDGGEGELRRAASEQLSGRNIIPAVPLVLDVRKAGVAGLAGPMSAVSGLARWLIVQAAILHSPGELIVMAALSEGSVPEWSWLKWLPHLRPDRAGLESAAVAIGRREAEELLVELRELVRRRQTQTRSVAGSPAAPARVLLLIEESVGVDRAVLSATLEEAAEYGVSVIWVGRDSRDLPGQCGAIVEIEPTRAILTFTDVGTGQVTKDVSAEALSLELAEATARLLAPIRDVSELARAGDIPRRVGLLDLLGMLPASARSLERRWSQWQGDLCATVGVGAEGPLTLDLRSEGPHALIAGTTGSGKSELLRTLVAAAAVATPPHRLSFLLIDYKGGAAFAPCASLPHVLDIVSDLDEHLAGRALISLNAELKRRERTLADHGAKDLAELLRRDPDVAPPLLVIAVDEFAKLREEVPQFVDGVVDIAQRGRSLGVHMVLAAQTLRNAFTPAIRANTNLRMALRVAEESESEDMIASPMAARIPSGEGSRGRAFARTGHGELREFQAAYVSGRSDVGQRQSMRLTAYEVDAIGTIDRLRDGDGADSDADSDLLALGRAACEARKQMGLPAPTPPWLPMLSPVVSLYELDEHKRESHGVAIGLVDLPHLQRQDPLSVNLESVGHVAVFGAGNSGKTTVLTSTALALARSATPEQVCIYGLDAASGKLGCLQALPHCGGVVMADEEERMHRLLRTLLRRIEQRHGSAVGATDRGPATIVLMLDDLGSLAHQYDRAGFESPMEQLQRVLSGGRAAGVHVILTASRRGALPPALAAHIGQRLVLRMPTEDDMLSFGLDAGAIRGAQLPPGRGFTQDSNEFQIAVPASDGAELSLEQAARAVAGRRARSAPSIEALSREVSVGSLPRAAGLDSLPIGIRDEDLAPATVDLTEMHLMVVGPYRSGRSTALRTLACAVRDACPSASFYLMASRRSPLRDLELWTQTATTIDACVELAGSLADGAPGAQPEPAFLLIDDGGELSDAMLAVQLERLVRIGRDGSLRVVAAVETGAARGIANSWIRELRREGHGLLLQPDLSADGELLAVPLPRRVAAPSAPGRGFLVARGSATLIQVASD
jgi:S-DNA-T family DNA segregation ATPase FtsK/SpoIIIE